nr:hypothetical protein [Vibrio metschnikovii]
MNPKTSDYQKHQRYQENEILEHAAGILATHYVRGDALTNPNATSSGKNNNGEHHAPHSFLLLYTSFKVYVIDKKHS